MKRRDFVAGATAALGYGPFSAHASSRSDIQLVFGLDYSSSMFGVQYYPLHSVVQLKGHIQALRSEDVSQLLIDRRARLHAVAWSDTLSAVCELALPVTIVDRASLSRFCDSLSVGHLHKALAGGGIDHSVVMQYVHERIPPVAKRRVLDISTDEGVYDSAKISCKHQRDLLTKKGWTVNALVVDDPAQNIVASMRKLVITRDGFVETVSDWEGYANALKRKLKRELMIS